MIAGAEVPLWAVVLFAVGQFAPLLVFFLAGLLVVTTSADFRHRWRVYRASRDRARLLDVYRRTRL